MWRDAFLLMLVSAYLGPRAHATTTAVFSVESSAAAVENWGNTIELTVRVSHTERMAACAYRIAVSGTASVRVIERTITPELPNSVLRYLGVDPGAPLEAGLPVALFSGEALDEVFLNLDTADPPGGPLDGLMPDDDVMLARYTLIVQGAGLLTFTLVQPRAAETQSDAGGANFDQTSVTTASVSLTVVGGPDVNGDSRVDLHDFAMLQTCAAQSPTGDCATTDVNLDGRVDGEDFAILQSCLTGPAQPPACAGPSGRKVQP